MTASTCPACLAQKLEPFYRCNQVPVHTTLLMSTHRQALEYPRRDIDLAYCKHCGFITNRCFETGIHEYSDVCEESQGCSPTFMNWLRGVAGRLVEDYEIHDKTILEIGSGKGEFLATICELGNNRGVGYDPAYVEGRLEGEALSNIDFRKEMWSHEHGLEQADVVVCRHTLEHIPNVLEFMQDIRTNLGGEPDTLLFFEVPDTVRILKEGAFWDIYYEHCSYFTQDSLCSLFKTAGFEVLECWLDYDNQYIMLIAKPTESKPVDYLNENNSQLAEDISHFRHQYAATQTRWSARLKTYAEREIPVMLWGGGSKAAAFLNRLDGAEVVRKVIDINPQKENCFIPVSGQEVVGPAYLELEAAEVIILMNSIYRTEVQKYLDRHHHQVELLSVDR